MNEGLFLIPKIKIFSSHILKRDFVKSLKTIYGLESYNMFVYFRLEIELRFFLQSFYWHKLVIISRLYTATNWINILFSDKMSQAFESLKALTSGK